MSDTSLIHATNTIDAFLNALSKEYPSTRCSVSIYKRNPNLYEVERYCVAIYQGSSHLDGITVWGDSLPKMKKEIDKKMLGRCPPESAWDILGIPR